MSTILIKNALVTDPSSKLNGQKADLLIEKGRIKSMGTGISAEAKEIFDADGTHISPGWLDIRANFFDPGHEYKEDLKSGAEAAAYGGFTAVAILPETSPRLSTKTQIEYVKHQSAGNIVDILPLAAISAEGDQNLISEMHDLKRAGAAGFSSGYSTIGDKGYLKRVMLYVSTVGLPLMLLAENKSLSGKGLINEGEVSVRMGLNGIPAIAEEVELFAIVALCRYTGTPVHISCITTESSLKMILEARKDGLPITASVSAHHLSFSDQDLEDFNNNLKLRPPLRTEKDRKALVAAVKKYDFLTVVSDHTPHEEDRKKCEFELAAFGATGLQTVYPEMRLSFTAEETVQALAIRPRQIMGLDVPELKEGAAANFTIFDPDTSWTLDRSTNRSKSRNNPYWGKELKGRARAICNNGRFKELK